MKDAIYWSMGNFHGQLYRGKCPHYPVLLRQDLSEFEAYSFSRLASGLQGTSCPLGVTDVGMALLCGCWDYEHRSSRFQGKYSTEGTFPSALQVRSFSVFMHYKTL